MESNDCCVSKVFKTVKNEMFYEYEYNDIKLIIDSNEYIFASKICSDNKKKFNKWLELKRTKDIIIKLEKYLEITETKKGLRSIYNVNNKKPMLMFKRDSGYRDLQGFYIHKKLLHYLCEWANIDYAFKVAEIMDLINEELHLRNIKLEDKINELETYIEQLKLEHNIYKTKINSGFNHEHPGCLIIRKVLANDKHYHIMYDEKQHFENSEKDIIINDIYNPQKHHSLINFYARNNQLTNIKYIKPNIVETDEVENIKNAIKEIQTFNVKLPSYDDIIKKTMNSFKENNYKLKAKMFEVYCSMKYKIPLYHNEKTELLSLTKQDKGVDLIDIKNGIIGQCKYYTTLKLSITKLETFVNFCKHLNDFKHKLFINGNCKLYKNIETCKLFEIVRVDEIEFDEWYDKNVSYSFNKTYDEKLTDARTWLKEELDKNEFIYLDDAIKHVSEFYKLNISNDNRFGMCFSDLYLHVRKNMIPTKDGRKILMKNIDKNDEINFIKSTIKFGQYTCDDYIQIHNVKFNTNYITHGFGQKFTSLFKRTNAGMLIRRTVNGKENIHILELDNEIEKRNEFIKFINQNKYEHHYDKHVNFKLETELMKKFNQKYHRYENIKTFRDLLYDLGFANLTTSWH